MLFFPEDVLHIRRVCGLAMYTSMSSCIDWLIDMQDDCVNIVYDAGAPFGSFGLKRALARTEEFLVLKTERNRLVDQVSQHYYYYMRQQQQQLLLLLLLPLHDYVRQLVSCNQQEIFFCVVVAHIRFWFLCDFKPMFDDMWLNRWKPSVAATEDEVTEYTFITYH